MMKKEASTAVRPTTAAEYGLGHMITKLVSPTKNKSEAKEITDRKMIQEVVRASNNTILLSNDKKVKVTFKNVLDRYPNDPRAALELMMKNEAMDTKK